MKLNRFKLRQLIIEVLTEGSHKYMVTPDGETYTMDQARIAKLTGRTLDAMSTGKHPKLDPLKKSDPDYARVLATDSDYQPELTQIEIGAQSLPDSDFNQTDTQLQDYSMSQSLEVIKHLKRECKKRGYDCTIKDERQFDPEDPFIALHISDGGAIDFSIHFGELVYRDMEIVIDIYDNLMRGIFEPYDYYSTNLGIKKDAKPDDFKNAALKIIDIVENPEKVTA